MYLELETYDRARVDGASVGASHIRDLCRKLSVLNYDERVALKSIGADRADLVVAGCAILESIMDLWPAEEIKVADRGIREGMLLDMMASHRRGGHHYRGGHHRSAGSKIDPAKSKTGAGRRNRGNGG